MFNVSINTGYRVNILIVSNEIIEFFFFFLVMLCILKQKQLDRSSLKQIEPRTYTYIWNEKHMKMKMIIISCFLLNFYQVFEYLQ